MHRLRLKRKTYLLGSLLDNRIELKSLLPAAFILLLMFTSLSVANDFHPLNDIEKTAEKFLQKRLAETPNNGYDIRIDSLDQRLKLSLCNTQLEAYLPPGAKLHGKSTVEIRCNSAKPWRIFVAVKLVVYEKVLAARRNILRGEVIKAADLVMIKNEITVTSQNNFRNIEQAAGLIAKHSIPAGNIITTNVVRAPRLVQRGQEVILLANPPST